MIGRFDLLGCRRLLPFTFVLSASIAVAMTWINVLSKLQDARNHGLALDWHVPLIEETTSAFVILALFPIPWRLAQLRASSRVGWAWIVAVHLAATFLFALLHVSGMIALRAIAFPAFGLADHYAGLSELLYEWRKDLAVYSCGVGIVLIVRLAFDRIGVAIAPPTPALNDVIEFRDGAKRVRIPAGDILAAHAAGNYVELILRDGRRPLIRSTLSALEPRLCARGSIRAHRSWLVNPDAIRVIEPRARGDFILVLEGSIKVPCSRRHAAALPPIAN